MQELRDEVTTPTIRLQPNFSTQQYRQWICSELEAKMTNFLTANLGLYPALGLIEILLTPVEHNEKKNTIDFTTIKFLSGQYGN